MLKNRNTSIYKYLENIIYIQQRHSNNALNLFEISNGFVSINSLEIGIFDSTLSLYIL